MIIYTTTLKRILKSPVSWVLILLFPVLFSIFMSIVYDDSPLTGGGSIPFGLVDQDNSRLSETLVNQLNLRFNVTEINEEEIPEALTGALLPSVLVIREGYGRNVLAGIAPVLDTYSLTVSDVSILGNIAAERTTHALMLLGTDDAVALARWEAASYVPIETVGARDNWPNITFLLGFYGLISFFAAFTIVRPLTDDKRRGMPERLGILPASPRSVLVQGALAAVTAISIGTVVLIGVVYGLLGSLANPVYLFFLLTLYNMFAVGFVLALVNFLKKMEAVTAILSMGGTVIAMLGGIFWPLEMVPPFMQRVAWFSPGYWYMRGIQNIRDISFENFVLPMIFLFGFAAIVILLIGWRKIQPMEE